MSSYEYMGLDLRFAAVYAAIGLAVAVGASRYWQHRFPPGKNVGEVFASGLWGMLAGSIWPLLLIGLCIGLAARLAQPGEKT